MISRVTSIIGFVIIIRDIRIIKLIRVKIIKVLMGFLGRINRVVKAIRVSLSPCIRRFTISSVKWCYRKKGMREGRKE